jgi:hypothetical protein
MPALLAYPILGFTAGCSILVGIGTVVGGYSAFFFPVPLFAAALGVSAAREWNRRGRRAFIGGCLGVLLATVALIPFGTNPDMLLPAMGVGLAAGVGLTQWIKR